MGFRKVEKDHADGKEDSKETMVLFDWERAFISHPFFDVQDFRDRTFVNEYLAQWGEYESFERAVECYKLARPLGPLLSAYSTLRCMEKGMPGDEVTMQIYFESCLQDSVCRLDGEEWEREREREREKLRS